MGRVVGSAVATAKSERLIGRKLLVVQPVTVRDEAIEDTQPIVALDLVGAGIGEVVLVSRGSAARVETPEDAPVDASIVAILDHIDIDGAPTYRKG